MARKFQTPAHAKARNSYACVICGHVLKNAKYGGEYCVSYDKGGNEKFIAVFLTCDHCGTIDEVSIDITDTSTFMDVVDDVTSIPHRAKKIVAAPTEETATP